MTFPGLGDGPPSNMNGNMNTGDAATGANSSTHITDNKSIEDFLTGIFSSPAGQNIPQQIPRPLSDAQINHPSGLTGSENKPPVPLPLPVPSTGPVPQHLLYGTSPESLDYTISTTGLQKMPTDALQRLAMKGNQTGIIVMMKNYHQVESMHRLKNFLDTGRYKPFNAGTVDYEDNGTKKTWVVNAMDSSIRATTSSKVIQDLFDQEIGLYFFATEIGFEELRRESMNNIRKYPKSVKGVWSLIEKIGQFEDVGLRTYILELLDANAGELTKLPEYLPFLKNLVKFEEQDRELGERLLDNYVSAVSGDPIRKRPALRPALEIANENLKPMIPSGPKESPRSASTLPVSSGAGAGAGTGTGVADDESPMKMSPDTRRSSSTFRVDENVTTHRKKDYSHLGFGFDPKDLAPLASNIATGRLVVTVEEGWGTLTQMGSGRNRDFSFKAGELMLQGYENAINGHNNIIVYNCKGERGDIRRAYVREVAPNLGVDRVPAIHVPSGLSDRVSDRSSFSRDREERTGINPNLINMGGTRKRSRSPGQGHPIRPHGPPRFGGRRP